MQQTQGQAQVSTQGRAEDEMLPAAQKQELAAGSGGHVDQVTYSPP